MSELKSQREGVRCDRSTTCRRPTRFDENGAAICCARGFVGSRYSQSAGTNGRARALRARGELLGRLGALLQLAHVCKLQGHHREAEEYFRAATETSPGLELASLGLFHTLRRLGRNTEALQEALRFLSTRESLGYRELFDGNAYGEDVAGDERTIASQIRMTLEHHRSRQIVRGAIKVGDTVRVRPEAPPSCRSGALARVCTELDDASIEAARGDSLFQIEFSDGERTAISKKLVSGSDI